MIKNKLKKISKLAVLSAVALMITACGSNKKHISIKLHSDPLGGHAMMKVNQTRGRESEWIYLGTTPVVTNKTIELHGANGVSFKVIREGFYDQEKTWSLDDFLKEHRLNKQIIWVPRMVEE